MKKFSVASLFVALSFVQVGCGDAEPAKTDMKDKAAAVADKAGAAADKAGAAADKAGDAAKAAGDAAKAAGDAVTPKAP